MPAGGAGILAGVGGKLALKAKAAALYGLAGVGGTGGIAVLVVLLGGGAQGTVCGPAGDGGAFADAPGSLGGVAGTGVTREELEAVREGSPFVTGAFEPGKYLATVYGPPWGGINGPGVGTSGGIPINGGAPRRYMLAVDPGYLGHGQLVYVWPNPFDWKGPFVTADTGGAIVGRHIDIYDWLGPAYHGRWPNPQVEVANQPLVPTGGGAPTPAALGGAPLGECPGGGGELGLVGETGEVVVLPGANREGVPLQRPLVEYLEHVAGVAGRRLAVCTGSNHSQYTASGGVSDHWSGLGADICSSANGFPIASPADGDWRDNRGTRIAAAGLRVAGLSEKEAWRYANEAGFIEELCVKGWRLQVIWLATDHWDHVHFGLREGCDFGGVVEVPY
ncbi:MAG: hypothetical protein GEU88_15355 [Solirubrobacterales bacterium]|nr:hypothetical protein [Solirubrobacterales bacterium]